MRSGLHNEPVFPQCVEACLSDSCINFIQKCFNTQSPHLFTRAYLPKTGESIHRPFVYSHTHISSWNYNTDHISPCRISFIVSPALVSFYLFKSKMCKNETSAKVLFGCFNTIFFVSNLYLIVSIFYWISNPHCCNFSSWYEGCECVHTMFGN